MSRETRKLARELRTIGVSKHEITELTHAAERLSHLQVPGMSAASRQRIAARLPVDVEVPEPRYNIGTVRWAMAGSMAVVVLIASAVWLLPDTANHTATHQGSHANQADKPTTPAPIQQQLQQQEQQLQQLQKQPVVDQQQVQKTKDDFQQKYELYQQKHANDKNFTNQWKDYQLQWWWRPTDSSQTKTQSTSSGQSSSSQSQNNSSPHH